MAAAAARTLPTPPPVSSCPLPSPTKKEPAFKPHHHPYAIKTTASGVLTRSNSTALNVNATRHYYIPPSPNLNRPDSKGHRASKSLNGAVPPESPTRDSPRPLPIPPALDHTINNTINNRRGGSGDSGGYVSADEVSAPPRRPKRAETLPVIPIPSPALSVPAADDLPENPKLWTPSQLATYLTAALRMTSSGKTGEIESIGLPALVAKDIAAFVKGARIGGRTFLRLNEDDLEGLGMNKKWRDALLTAARNLRQNVLKDRIWGLDGSSPARSPSPQPASPPKIFANAQLNSSSSSIESSASISAGDDDPTSGAGAALGRAKARRYRNGRVRGMIDTFERSGSFSSDGGLDDSEPRLGDERANVQRWVRSEAKITGQRVVESPSPSPSRRRPLPIPPSPGGSITMVADEDPTMEALLAEIAQSEGATGARAWEEMDLAHGVTVKRVPLGGDMQAQIAPVPEFSVRPKTFAGLGSGKSSGSSSKGKGERRVVTAIFAPAGSDSAAAVDDDVLKPLEATNGLEAFEIAVAEDAPMPMLNGISDGQPKSRPLPPTPGHAVAEQVPEGAAPGTVDFAPEPPHLERLLEEEILATRTLLDTFRARLEVVEQKVADLEVREALREREREQFARSAVSHPQTHSQTRTDAASASHESVEIGVQSGCAVGADVLRDAPLLDDEEEDKEDYFAAGSGPAAALTLDPGLSGDDSDNAKGKIKPPSSSSSPASEPSSLASALSASALQAVIPDVVRRLHAPAALFSSSYGSEVAVTKGEDGDGDEDPSSLADLPSYVFLVGLGVCAVVIRVVLRKVVGKGSLDGFRP